MTMVYIFSLAIKLEVGHKSSNEFCPFSRFYCHMTLFSKQMGVKAAFLLMRVLSVEKFWEIFYFMGFSSYNDHSLLP